MTSTHRPTNYSVLFAASISVALLVGALIFQSLGYAPCKLCFWQRWPHAIAPLLASITIVFHFKPIFWLGALNMAASTGLAIYHSGVERALWQGPSSCSGSSVSDLSLDALMLQINAAPLIRCDEISWRLSDLVPLEFLNLSMANLNIFFSFVLMIIWIKAATRKDGLRFF